MARPIVLSNGEMHVGLNKYGLVHDLYYPYVGFENHAAGANLRHKIGVWIDGKISWLDDGSWQLKFHYPHTALIGHTLAKNLAMQVMLEFDDFIDSDISAFIRNIHIINLSDKDRDIRLFMHQAFAIGDSRSNTDTAQYLPDSNAILHYRGRRAFVISGTNGEKQPFDQFSIGLFGIEGHEGSYRDADDGILQGNPVEHGRVDSVLRFQLSIPAHSSSRVHYWIAAGMSIREALYIHGQVAEDGVATRLHSTADWWRQWLQPTLRVAEKVPIEYRELFTHSAMIIKSQIDKRGAVMASTDSSLLNYSRDAYAYSWARDGAYTIWPLIRLGYQDEVYRFFDFCKRGLHSSGYLMHKYRADGALGSSWHPYVHDNDTVAPPIQEDETALVVFVFAQAYQAWQDSTLLKDFFQPMIKPMADFMTDYVDSSTGLPKPSYDLWEQQFAVFTYTTSVVYAALHAAADLAEVVGENDSAVKWRSAAEDIGDAGRKHLFNTVDGVLYKSLNPDKDQLIPDPTLDSSSILGAFMFGLFDSDSAEITQSVAALVNKFNVTAESPGVPRYEHDDYRRKNDTVTGNWWYITSLWHAEYLIGSGDRDGARRVLDWVVQHSLDTRMLGEQVDPTTGDVISPAPLTWSHAEFLSAVLDIIRQDGADA